MTPRRIAGKTSVRSRMRIARKRLKEANDAMRLNNYDNTCNRSYYAVFEATHAMLSAKGIDEPNSHKGLRIKFDDEIVNKGLFDKNTAEFYTLAEDNRNLADYVETDVSKERADESLSMVTDYISTVSTSLRRIRRARERENSPDFGIAD